MADLGHFYGEDLQIAASGDLALADASLLGQQRVLRRLLTNPLDDAWNPDYGAGLPRFVGQPSASLAIVGVIRVQLRREAAVAASPAPGISVTAAPSGTVIAGVQYVDSVTGTTALISAPIGG